MSLEDACIRLLEETTYDSLSVEEINRIVTLLAHDAAMGAISSDHPLVHSLLGEEEALLGGVGYTLLGKSFRSLSRDLAVQHNAMAITASIREDFTAGTHPGAILFPLLWAESESRHYESKTLITAAAIGLKLAQLLNGQLGKALADKGFRATTVIGAIAGAGAVVWLQGSSSAEAFSAMAIAASAACGLAFPFQEGTEEWLTQVPNAAHIAYSASRIVKGLHFSHTHFLTGSNSLGTVLNMTWDTNKHIDPLQETDLMQIGVKKHPVNSFVQPVVEAVLRITTSAEEIEKVVVEVPDRYPRTPTLAHPGPFSMPNLALLSIPVSSAIALVKKKIAFEDLQSANDPEILRTAAKITMVYSSELTSYDVRIKVHSTKGMESIHVTTAAFYPSLEEELEWIRQHHSRSLPWVDQVLNTMKPLPVV